MASLNCKDGKTVGWKSALSKESGGSVESLGVRSDEDNEAVPSAPVAGIGGGASPGHGHGLTLISAATFIVGEMAGSGILALPQAVSGMGWTGIFIIILCCLASGYAAVYLGKCWLIIEERYPEHQKQSRDPFSVIGLKAYGPKMKGFVTFNIIAQLFGVSVVFLLLASELVQELLKPYVHITLCDWIIILGFVLCPLMWFGSPMDISPIAYGAMSCTAISCVLLIILFGEEAAGAYGVPHKPAEFGNITFSSIFLSLGTILFAFGGAATFPTFQNDMKDKTKFPYAVGIGFTMMLMLYLPVAGGGYALYGDNVSSNVIENVRGGAIKTTIDILMAFHVLCAFLIVINPVNLSFEQSLGIRHSFNLFRTGFRTLVLLLVIFVGLTVPKFGKILNLVGGSTVALTSFIMPPIFYMRLASQESENWQARPVSTTTKVILSSIALLGLIGGCTSTYSAVKDLFAADALTKPCYVW